MSQLINDSLYRASSPSIQELYGTYTSKAEGINAVKNGVYKNVPKGLKFGVVTTNGFEEYIYVGPVMAKANVQADDFIKIFPLDEATINAAGLMSATDKAIVDQFITVLESGGWNVDSNFQPGGTSTSQNSQVIPEGLEARLTRIEAILQGLYGDTSADDLKFIVSDDGNSNN